MKRYSWLQLMVLVSRWLWLLCSMVSSIVAPLLSHDSCCAHPKQEFPKTPWTCLWHCELLKLDSECLDGHDPRVPNPVFYAMTCSQPVPLIIRSKLKKIKRSHMFKSTEETSLENKPSRFSLPFYCSSSSSNGTQPILPFVFD
jgi:hypothetical protein